MTETTLMAQGAFPVVPYRDPRQGIAWMERVLGARATAVYPPEADQPLVHAEVLVGEGIVMPTTVAGARDEHGPFAPPGPATLYVVVTDPDALHARATAGGAEIVMGLTDTDYGSRDFAVRDPDGNVWAFGTYRPAVPAEAQPGGGMG